MPLSAVTLELGEETPSEVGVAAERRGRRRRLNSAGLVSLTFVIETPDAAAADEAAQSLDEQMQDAQAASQLLTTPQLGVANVDVINLAPFIEEVPSPPPAPAPPPANGTPPQTSGGAGDAEAPPPTMTPVVGTPPAAATSPPPASPGKVYASMVSFQLTVSGTLETFDRDAFKAALAATLANGITPADVTLTVTEGSVVVDASVRAPSSTAAAAAASTFNAQSTQSLTEALGVTVTVVTPATVAVVVVDAPPDSLGDRQERPDGNSAGIGLVIGAAVGGGVLVAAIVAVIVARLRAQRVVPGAGGDRVVVAATAKGLPPSKVLPGIQVSVDPPPPAQVL